MKHVVFSFIFPTWAAMQVTVRFENLGKVFFEKREKMREKTCNEASSQSNGSFHGDAQSAGS
jgi:hypothetical protein